MDRVFARSLSALDQGLAKADFFNFVRFDAVFCYVVNPVLRPDELVDRHPLILGDRSRGRNVSAGRAGAQTPRFPAVGCSGVLLGAGVG